MFKKTYVYSICKYIQAINIYNIKNHLINFLLIVFSYINFIVKKIHYYKYYYYYYKYYYYNK